MSIQPQLIPVFSGTINHEAVQLVDARVLHRFLAVNARFNDWISRRIAEYGFVEGDDFILVTQNRVTKSRGGDRRSKHYHLTLDMAKELSMVERNEQGRQARRYFIECEKRLQQVAPQDAGIIAARHFHQTSLDRITITEEQHRAIAGFISSISNGMLFKYSWHQGMWYALRQATGTPSPNRFLARDLPVIAHELQRIGEVAQAFHTIAMNTSIRAVKEAIRKVGNEDAVLASIEREFEAVGNIPGQVPLGLLGDLRSTLGVI